MEDRLQQIIALTKNVGNIQTDYFNKKHEVEKKSTQFDIVTEVDKLSEKMIVDWLSAHYPQDAILAEEGSGHSGQSEFTWVVDPLDGTTNYSHRFPIYAVSIALTRAGETVLGVVYVPALDELFHAVRGRGAFVNGTPLSVSDCASLEAALVATGFPYDRKGPHNNLAQFNHLCPLVQGVRRTGSAAYDLCCVAAGMFDGFWELQLHVWDVAAATLIIEEAGGSVVFLSKQGTEVSLLAGNKLMSDLLFKELQTLMTD